MGRLYVNQTLEKEIRQYCEVNDIDDVNAFANRCLRQGLSIIKFGISPIDNVERENKGIKDFKSNENVIRDTEEQAKEQRRERNIKEEKDISNQKREEKEVSVRKIRIIKK